MRIWGETRDMQPKLPLLYARQTPARSPREFVGISAFGHSRWGPVPVHRRHDGSAGAAEEAALFARRRPNDRGLRSVHHGGARHCWPPVKYHDCGRGVVDAASLAVLTNICNQPDLIVIAAGYLTTGRSRRARTTMFARMCCMWPTRAEAELQAEQPCLIYGCPAEWQELSKGGSYSSLRQLCPELAARRGQPRGHRQPVVALSGFTGH
jgi:hypothetical protein